VRLRVVGCVGSGEGRRGVVVGVVGVEGDGGCVA